MAAQGDLRRRVGWVIDRTGNTWTRRQLLGAGAAGAVVLALARCGGSEGGNAVRSTGPFAKLERTPDDLIELPRGFSTAVLAPKGSLLRDGSKVPGNHDGMGTFARGDQTVLVRNHELVSDDDANPVGSRPFDPGEPGCTIAVVVGRDRSQLDAYVASSGTRRNCAGGVTPWGTWLTCEEDVASGHGYVFEVQWDDPENDLSRRPIEAMGRFSHEAAAVDPASGTVYLTEDDHDNDTSFFYRFLPKSTAGRPGSLHEGGRLQALADTGGRVRWLDVDPATAHDDALERGAHVFRRLEGCCLHKDAIWFTDTNGGKEKLGQLFRFDLAAERLALAYEASQPAAMEAPDNVTPTPWGDLWLVEDGPFANRILGVGPKGDIYAFARVADDELAGPCFSPDGRTFFVNLYREGITLAIWGPFPQSGAMTT